MEHRGRTTEVRSNSKANRSLWTGGKPTKIEKPGQQLPSKITGILTLEQMSAYQAMYRIEEITQLLKSNQLEPPKTVMRSESPPPKYDTQGRRTNSREQRYRKKLEEERYRLVEIAWRMIPFYKHPEGYVKPSSFEEKYYIPVDQYPEINFVGLLLGPRGKTLKDMQLESKCKIAIRGRGSVKEGKSASDLPDGAMNMEDPLHCLIIADSEDKVYKGVKCCQRVVIKAVTSPEGQNDLKRNQLRDLAELNGTLREDNTPCSICGLQGHKKYDCPERESFAQRIVCHRCGQPGHITRDCIMQIPQTVAAGNNVPYGQSRYQNNINVIPSNHTNWNARQTPPGSASRYQNNLIQQTRYSDGYNHSNNNRDYNSPPASTITTGRYQSRYQRRTTTAATSPAASSSQQSFDHSQQYNSANETYSNSGTKRRYNPSNISSRESSNAPLGIESTPETHFASSNLHPQENLSPAPPGLSAIPGVPGLDTSTLPPGLSNESSMNPTLPPGLSDIDISSTDHNNKTQNIGLPPGLSSTESTTGLNLPPGLSGPPGL